MPGRQTWDFVLLNIYSNRRAGRSLRVDELLALWEVWRKGTTNITDLAPVLQRSTAHTAGVLEDISQTGILHCLGNDYYLSSTLGVKTKRQAIPPAEAILTYVRDRGQITRREVMAITGLTEDQANYELRKMTQRGDLEQVGTGRGTHYHARIQRNAE